MNTDSESELELEFVQAAKKRSDLLRRGEPKRANKEFDRLHKVKKKMRDLPDRGEAILKRIAATDDLQLKILAAASMLAVDESYASKVLEEIAARDVAGSFEAEMTLKEWRKGSIKAYWS